MDVDYSEPRFVTPDPRYGAGRRGPCRHALDTVKAWAGQRSSRRKMFTRNPRITAAWPSVPLVGLVEANTLRTLGDAAPSGRSRRQPLWIRQRFEAPLP